MESRLVIGYIGNGKSANRYHIPFVLNRKDKIKIKAIYDPHLENSIWKRIDGVKYTSDLDELLHDSEIQVIVVCTPHNTHYEITKKVLNAGKNCVCEKPFTETEAQAKELFEIASEKNLMLQCYQNRRFDGEFLTAKKIIESGVIGEVMEVEISFDYWRPEVPHTRKYAPTRGFYYGHACHTIDQVISYWGIPDKVVYDVRQLLGHDKMNDYFDVDLFYGNKKISLKSSYFRVKARSAFTVYGFKGMYEKITNDKQEEHLKMFIMPGTEGFGVDKPSEYGSLIYYDESGTYHEEKVITVQGDYARYYDALYDTIINGKPQLVKPQETIAQIRILENGIKKLNKN